jgi:hypothetical protein
MCGRPLYTRFRVVLKVELLYDFIKKENIKELLCGSTLINIKQIQSYSF